MLKWSKFRSCLAKYWWRAIALTLCVLSAACSLLIALLALGWLRS